MIEAEGRVSLDPIRSRRDDIVTGKSSRIDVDAYVGRTSGMYERLAETRRRSGVIWVCRSYTQDCSCLAASRLTPWPCGLTDFDILAIRFRVA